MDDIRVQLFLDAGRTESLTKLELLRLNAQVCMRNDESLNIDVKFGELALEDTRTASAGGITKLIRNKENKKGAVNT